MKVIFTPKILYSLLCIIYLSYVTSSFIIKIFCHHLRNFSQVYLSSFLVEIWVKTVQINRKWLFSPSARAIVSPCFGCKLYDILYHKDTMYGNYISYSLDHRRMDPLVGLSPCWPINKKSVSFFRNMSGVGMWNRR